MLEYRAPTLPARRASAAMLGNPAMPRTRRVIWLALATIMVSSAPTDIGMTLTRCNADPDSDGVVMMVIRLATRVSSWVVCRSALRRPIDLDRKSPTLWCRVLDSGMIAVKWLMKQWHFPLAGISLVEARGRTRQFLLLKVVTLPCMAVESMLRLRLWASAAEFIGLREWTQLLIMVCNISTCSDRVTCVLPRTGARWHVPRPMASTRCIWKILPNAPVSWYLERQPACP